MSLAKNIRRLREQNNMTQEELAKKVDVTQQSIGNYERKNVTPRPETLVEIAKALGTTVEKLVRG